jgi:CheY-like chemotaxis protein/anti-sigma regulatory factor (Ser/Thr protein kinase)
MGLEISLVRVQDICQSSIGLVTEQAHKKSLSIALQLDEQVTTLWADARRLKQMLVNLLSNAIKFTPQGGQIGLDVTSDSEADLVQFIVWDTGIGIAEQDIPNLFQAFVQLDSSISRHYEGTGLGLALVAQIIKLHGGSIRVESEPDQGSRFIIQLPCLQPDVPRSADHKVHIPQSAAPFTVTENAPQAENDGRSQHPSQPKAHILIVEDTESVTLSIRDYLMAKGYRVTVARNGAEGIDQAHKLSPDLILMDVHMPDLDGLQATRIMRADTRLQNTPIIALTALAMPGDRQRCLEAGMNDYLSKPVRLKHLLEIVEENLGQSNLHGAQ